MKYPIIINPFEKITLDYDLIDKNANEFFFKQFQIKFRGKKDVPIYLYNYEPRKPNFNFFERFDFNELDFLALIGLILIWWLVIPILIILFIIDCIKYVSDFNDYKIQYKDFINKQPSIIVNNKKYNEFIDNEIKEFEIFKNKNKLEYLETIEYFRKNSRENLIKELSLKIISPIKINNTPRKGISENYFTQHLNNYFDFIELEIITDFKIDYYFPDIIIKTSNNIYIDIEIDEPYIWDTKEVIHYYEPNEDYYSDELRNETFEEMGWIVIRFTERQIIKQTNSCCYEIAFILSKILDFKIPKEKIYPEVEPEELWSKSKGNELAEFDYRKSYLTKELSLKYL